MATYFTADTHFGHKGILNHSERPFSSVEEMDACLIENWNSTVSPDDDIYHLGDVAWKRSPDFLDKLNGRKHLVWGNHDRDAIKGWSGWSSSAPYQELKIEGRKVILFHYPIAEWNGFWYDSLHFYGHVHDNRTANNQSCDVGCDTWNHRPVEFGELVKFMEGLEAPEMRNR